YNQETLYEYIDGGAELYISYGFKEVLSRKYIKSGQPDILVEIFDMDSSVNAYGIFSHSREEIDTTFGQGSQYTSGLMLFWKDKFYISILASPENKYSKQAIFDLAKIIDATITSTGPIPDIVNLLPQKNLVLESIRYFRHYIWLNSHYYIADQNILNIDNQTNAVLAKYLKDKKQCILLLVNYPDQKKVTKAFENFKQNYLPELSINPVVQIEDGTWTGCKINRNLISIVFNAAEKNWAMELLDSLKK
ncbi:DUF6599 family protein, partial [Calditrichota bacterium]